MKKINIIFLGLTLVLLIVIIAGCKKQATKQEEILDTLIIDRSCPFDNASLAGCCDNICTTYCADNNRAKFKNEINIKEPVRHCLCWCS